MLPEEKPCADSVSCILGPGSQDKNAHWIRTWNIRFWNVWLVKCQVTQSCVNVTKWVTSSLYMLWQNLLSWKFWQPSSMAQHGWRYACSFSSLHYWAPIRYWRLKNNETQTWLAKIRFAVCSPFSAEEGMILREVMIEVRLDQGLLKLVDQNFDGTLESPGMFFKKIPCSTKRFWFIGLSCCLGQQDFFLIPEIILMCSQGCELLLIIITKLSTTAPKC